jgi:hypothetical protein
MEKRKITEVFNAFILNLSPVKIDKHLDNITSFSRKIYEVNDQTFDDIALELFHIQATENQLYRSFIDHLRIRPREVQRLDQIPFMPVSFFKRHAIATGSWNAETVFTSSSTSGAEPSKHLVADLEFYLQHARRCFEYHFGPLTDYHFLALLPSYLERSGSSLIYMIEDFIRGSGSEHSGFYLRNVDELLRKTSELKAHSGRKVILWGVTFALLDLAENHQVDLSHCYFFETGGMKGRRKEITRKEFYTVLEEQLTASKIFSEYGMTELLSQAYTRGDTRFVNPPWMKVLGRDLSDPLQKGVINETAALNIIDLANYRTMSFIETEDLGKVYQNGTFEVLGRIDNSDIRGCNLMV